MNFWDKGGRDAPPVFNVDGVSYLYVKVRLSAARELHDLCAYPPMMVRETQRGGHDRMEACFLWQPPGKMYRPLLS